MIPTRQCSKCGEIKPLTDFYKNNQCKEGYRYECKICTNKLNKMYRKNMKEETKENKRKYDYKRRFNIPLEDYYRMLRDQDYKCAICGCDYTEYKERRKMEFCTDHNHKTNEIRGLLCDGCNRGIGHLQDNPEILRKAADYLEERGNY